MESSRTRASVHSRIGVAPRLRLKRCPRTACAGFTSMAWPVTSQSNQCLSAARCCLTESGASVLPAPGCVRRRRGFGPRRAAEPAHCTTRGSVLRRDNTRGACVHCVHCGCRRPGTRSCGRPRARRTRRPTPETAHALRRPIRSTRRAPSMAAPLTSLSGAPAILPPSLELF